MGEDKKFVSLTGGMPSFRNITYFRETREQRLIKKAESRRQMKKPARGGGRP